MELPGIRLTDKQLFAFVVVPLFLLFARYGLHDPRQGPAAPPPSRSPLGDPDGFMREVRQRHLREAGWPH